MIKKYFNKQKFFGKDGLKTVELTNFEDLSVKSVSGTTFLVDIIYWAGEGTISKSEYATAKIEKTAESYKVINFDRKR